MSPQLQQSIVQNVNVIIVLVLGFIRHHLMADIVLVHGLPSGGATSEQMLLVGRSTEEQMQTRVAGVGLLPVELLVQPQKALLLEPAPAELAQEWLALRLGCVVLTVAQPMFLRTVHVQIALIPEHVIASAASMPGEFYNTESFGFLG